MSTDKTPLHAVVSVICDCLSDLKADDQVRALEATCVMLGLRSPVAPRDPAYQKHPALELIGSFGRLLRPDQLSAFVSTLDMEQRILLMEILKLGVDPE